MGKQQARVTPAATAMFVYLNKPKTKFKAEGKYEATLVFDADNAFIAELEAEAKAAFNEYKKGLKPAETKDLYYNSPVKEVVDENGAPTGQLSIKFSSNAQFKSKKTGEIFQTTPKVFDAKKKLLNPIPNVGSGSTLKISFNTGSAAIPSNAKIVDGKGKMVDKKIVNWFYSLYLNAAQIIDLVEFGGDFGFGEEEGYEAEVTSSVEAPAEDLNPTEF